MKDPLGGPRLQPPRDRESPHTVRVTETIRVQIGEEVTRYWVTNVAGIRTHWTSFNRDVVVLRAGGDDTRRLERFRAYGYQSLGREVPNPIQSVDRY